MNKIDLQAAAALALLLALWLGCVGMDIYMYLNWASGVPRHAKDWQGMIPMTFGVIGLPCYAWLLIKPKAPRQITEADGRLRW